MYIYMHIYMYKYIYIYIYTVGAINLAYLQVYVNSTVICITKDLKSFFTWLSSCTGCKVIFHNVIAYFGIRVARLWYSDFGKKKRGLFQASIKQKLSPIMISRKLLKCSFSSRALTWSKPSIVIFYSLKVMNVLRVSLLLSLFQLLKIDFIKCHCSMQSITNTEESFKQHI